jgi:hypothetical protein
MEKYYKKNINELKLFNSSIPSFQNNNEEKIIDKVSTSLKEWLRTYMKKYETDVEHKIKENEEKMLKMQSIITQNIKTTSDLLLQQVDIEVKKLEKPLERNIINQISGINAKFLTELLETQKKISSNISKEQSVFSLSMKQDFDDLEKKLLSTINNTTLFNEFDKFKQEVYTQMSEIQYNKLSTVEEKLSISLINNEDIDIEEYMLLESVGSTTESGELVVRPSSFQSKTIVGTYNHQHELDNSIFRNILIIDINVTLNLGDLITTSNIPGVCQKQMDIVITDTTVGKLIGQINWLNMKEVDGVYYNFGVGLCKCY